jgi:hypothetical protein
MDTARRLKPLLPTDPARVGHYRLLGRLGSGGMGVVHLGGPPSSCPATPAAPTRRWSSQSASPEAAPPAVPPVQ